MGIGAIWAYAILKTFTSFDVPVRIYVVFFSMNMALVLSGFSIGQFYFTGDPGTDTATAVT